jgi:hypothetical protein|mmetsp:Transcript_7669/g.17164  ORF Transcript_7669/g.17164 Transcript_7669/m.17164 type:complete len:89 (+) Transcript_7669:507-773(+)|eukprot:CAMPEP_0181196086 /NCGR_PEP_ID=MMETSP1096-20121128/15257_1 /TAXON_ID=156174 ORGANISM="Chrysochromulina ericina, Strain CCMP281" /NCGR_SAMPLE_ID=MMETSP1096 /ASSEMBLY_ACC=CAM_ASM_000453 /LENGTH=88 /DNA_ID=CAMNT_0023285781 /DNA_START=465 /DNA_END=731 /DNA_ORIENTATION=-
MLLNIEVSAFVIHETDNFSPLPLELALNKRRRREQSGWPLVPAQPTQNSEPQVQSLHQASQKVLVSWQLGVPPVPSQPVHWWKFVEQV